MRGHVLASAFLFVLGCQDTHEGPRFGSVELLPGDVPGPDLPPETRLSELTPEDRSVFCDWLLSLSRPSGPECQKPEDPVYYLPYEGGGEGFISSANVVAVFCRLGDWSELPDCELTLEQLVACSVDTADCETRTDTPKRCDVLLTDECRYETQRPSPD